MTSRVPHSSVQTHTYKTVSGTAYLLDLYLPDPNKFSTVAALAAQILSSASRSGFGVAPPPAGEVDGRLPVMVYWHGGGLVAGDRERNAWFPDWLLDDALNAGFCFISAEYSLLHPGDGFNMIQDAKDVVYWVATTLNQKLAMTNSEQQVHPGKIVVAGSSAGGYITYLSGLYAIPRPAALLPIFAMGGNFLHPSYLSPRTEPFFYGQPLLPSGDEFAHISATPHDAPPVVRTASGAETEKRLGYYAWLLQDARLNDALSGQPGLTATLAASSKSDCDPFTILTPLQRILYPHLCLTASFPPTLLVHGTADSIVPFAESVTIHTRLKELSVECLFLKNDGGEHGFDIPPGGGRVNGLERCVPWLKQRCDNVK